MPSFLKIVGKSFVGLWAVAFVCAADAAPARNTAGANNAGRGRAGTSMASSMRMPTLPTLPGFTTGNTTQDLPSDGANNTPGDGGGTPDKPDRPDHPDRPDRPDRPDKPDRPDRPDKPDTPECPDGGVRNSEYTIENCMNDVQSCVNQSLPAGIASMYNEDLRNSIVNGMGLCTVQVEKCVTQVRRDCRNVYRAASDVWIDFNARRVQPEYYTFVLRKTGLTPNQAENTCLLLDVNTYGSSFNAVANAGTTTAEYNRRIGAYNGQGGVNIVKKNPQGAMLNYGNPGVDGARGHYARWDASTAECYIRVAAYNKDKHIKNSWLFGAAGDDQPAEVWRAAGDTFTCNKDLFGFSLMNDTATTAVVGIGGGTLVGAGVGALAGHGKRAFDCSNDKHREMLLEEIQATGSIVRLNSYLTTPLSTNGSKLSRAECEDILDLQRRYLETKQALEECTVGGGEEYVKCKVTITEQWQGQKPDPMTEEETKKLAAEILKQCGAAPSAQGQGAYCESFPTLNLARAMGRGVYECSAVGGPCVSASDVKQEVAVLDKILTDDVAELIEKGQKSNMLASVATGAAIGAGAGGIATGIVALVEHSNINCRLGDGLAQVGMGKAYSIGSLRDFYVKWNLNLPDTVAPTAQINDCVSWRSACSQYTNARDCKNAQVNYKPSADMTTTLIRSACEVSGSACIENYPVARSYGVCE